MASEWIFCCDRLPALTNKQSDPEVGEWIESDPVLVYSITNNGTLAYGIGQYCEDMAILDGGKRDCYWYGITSTEDCLESSGNSIIAWQPLPEPPEE